MDKHCFYTVSVGIHNSTVVAISQLLLPPTANALGAYLHIAKHRYVFSCRPYLSVISNANERQTLTEDASITLEHIVTNGAAIVVP